MLKTDRGTILYLRLFKAGSDKPMMINAFSEEISGIAFDTTDLDKAFSEGTLSGFPKDRPSKSISLIKTTGAIVDAADDFGFGNAIERVEFTVVYPDGTAKIGARSAKDGIGTLVWDDDLIRKIRSMRNDFYWTGVWGTNPALLVIKQGEVVDRACDHSTTHGCNGY